jgi:hypothetical protein
MSDPLALAPLLRAQPESLEVVVRLRRGRAARDPS